MNEENQNTNTHDAEITEEKSLPVSGWRKVLPAFVIILLLVFSYSIIRYHVIKGVAWDHFPLYISNKAIALGAVVFIGISYLLGNLSKFIPIFFARRVYLRKYFGLFGFGLASIHTIISLALLRPYYYEKFFTDDHLNLVGELSLLFGVLALFVFSIVAIASLPSMVASIEANRWRSILRKGYWGLLLILGHVLTMGLKGWLDPSHWPGGLLPISLVAFIFGLFVILVKLVTITFFHPHKPESETYH